MSLDVTGSFDDMHSAQIRFLDLAANGSPLHVHLWSDELVKQQTGQPPKFPETERQYFLHALRSVSDVIVVSSVDPQHRQFDPGDPRVKQFPPAGPIDPISPRKKVFVTGCYDYLHTGHVRFFEEVSAFGDVYVTVGNDANIELLKGKGHPHFPQDERRYMVSQLRFVKQALVASGMGWLDAEAEIAAIRPDIYAVNEDGDKPQKREYCQAMGIAYRVLKRLPRPGLTARSSTELRGF